jgi:uncharacterized protein (DUF2141 family)
MQAARSILLALATIAVALVTVPAEAADLQVTVTGIRAPVGNVHFAVFVEPDAFPKEEGIIAEIVTKANGENVQANFDDLGSGQYAIAVFHDENGNREFDTDFFGFPVEGYGFANNARVILGPPSFEAASVVVDSDGAHITIRITY